MQDSVGAAALTATSRRRSAWAAAARLGVTAVAGGYGRRQLLETVLFGMLTW
jgi:hypothetical protein